MITIDHSLIDGLAYSIEFLAQDELEPSIRVCGRYYFGELTGMYILVNGRKLIIPGIFPDAVSLNELAPISHALQRIVSRNIYVSKWETVLVNDDHKMKDALRKCRS